jgi:hypothetical protein
MARSGKVRIDDPEQFLQKARQMIREVHGPIADADIMMRDFDPLLTMAVAATDPNVPLQSKAKIGKDLAEFLYAKKKAVEVDGDFGSDPTIQVVVWGGEGQVQRVSKAEELRTLGHEESAPAELPAIEAAEMQPDDDV